MDSITVRHARTHNLKNLSLSIPKNRLCVITGLSGSGKSSLAFDTLYAEGQRRYVESLSSYARQFLQLSEKPDADSIEGLSPAISIEQKSASHNPRSTVGTVTEINDYLRLLFARIGTARCPVHGNELKAQTVSQITDRILSMPEGSRIMIAAPIVRSRKGEHRQLLSDLSAKGFIRIRIDGQMCDPADPPELKLHVKHDIDVIVDRVKVRSDIAQRVAESLETAVKLTGGPVRIIPMDEHKEEDELLLSASRSCPVCGYSIPELEPRNFSFNSPHGACPVCDGLGRLMSFSIERLIKDPEMSISEGVISLFDLTSRRYYFSLLPFCKKENIDINKPFKDLSLRERNLIFFGNADGIHKAGNYAKDDKRGKSKEGKDEKENGRGFIGIIPKLEKLLAECDSESTMAQLQEYTVSRECPECHGRRIRNEYCHVFVKDKSLPQVNDMSVLEAYDFFNNLSFDEQDAQIASRILKEVCERLMFLCNVGLGYLTLSRSADSLSGGEAQRIRLAGQIGSGLTGVMYVLDEPSIGLHQRDNDRLLSSLLRLRDLGNTVIVVEHDEDTIRKADFIADIGPGAGVHGGELVVAGTLKDVLQCKNSLTADYLSGRKFIPLPLRRKVSASSDFITMKGCCGNNLQNVTLKVPLGCLTVVTGVSGSGKSTLINDTLVPAVSNALMRSKNAVVKECAPFDSIEGFEKADKLICIDQSPIGRTPRSNPATYTGFFTEIRELFASTTEARARGYSAGRFSFNVKGGRCEACKGDGTVKVEMHFLPDIYVQCSHCRGKRYNRETLEITWKGKNIAEILEMTVEDALKFFDAVPSVRRKLQALSDVGLSYISLGQSALTFSGGEAQRIKLAKELSRISTGKTIYVLDEPTTGLHFHDVKQLTDMLLRLKNNGNTVVIIEHNLDVIKIADHIIDLGPEGGSGGGRIIATGSPEEIAANPDSFTGIYLKQALEQTEAKAAGTEAKKKSAPARKKAEHAKKISC